MSKEIIFYKPEKSKEEKVGLGHDPDLKREHTCAFGHSPKSSENEKNRLVVHNIIAFSFDIN